ncbi:MAG TPA: hypothetical protein VHC22_18410 [Pirellulales bacterium]|nr:hypothetical protein [Pirellulales bacterium]
MITSVPAQPARKDRPWRLCLLTAVAAAGICACGSEQVRASCGDYVHVGGYAAAHQGFVGELSPADSRELPCSGPNCSRAPDRPPASPAEPMAPVAKNWAGSLPGYLFAAEPAVAAWFGGSTPVFPTHYSAPPDRPPRHLTSGAARA